MIYEIEFAEEALIDIANLKRSEPHAYKKLLKLLIELQEHPEIGTGQIEPLRGNWSGYYSRRISQKHRLIYSIDDEEILVYVISAFGHYSEK